MNSPDLLSLGRSVLKTEARALDEAARLLDHSFVRAVEAIAQADAVFISGVGKPYLVGTKTAASMASLGIRAMTIHPVDALHGDMGRVQSGDVVLLASKSGESSETIEFARALSSRGAFRIAMTENSSSPLASTCELTLVLPSSQEADRMGLVPTTSTAVLMAIGDALSVGVAEQLGVETSGFANNHPAGVLGRRILAVTEFMRPLSGTPQVSPQTSIADTLVQTSKLRAGAAFVLGEGGQVLGIFTDGDLRRGLAGGRMKLADPVSEYMSGNPVVTDETTTGGQAVSIMREKKIDELGVIDAQSRLIGFIDIIDLS